MTVHLQITKSLVIVKPRKWSQFTNEQLINVLMKKTGFEASCFRFLLRDELVNLLENGVPEGMGFS